MLTPAVTQARHPCFGTIVDAEGQAIAAAAVTLVWSPGFGMPGEPDVVHAVADARGRFKADVVVGHAYTAWAIGPTRDDGSRLVSGVNDRAAAGCVIELAAWHSWRPRRVRYSGHEPWAGGAPPKLQVLPDGRGSFMGAQIEGKDGEFEMPPTPWTPASIGLLDAEGRLVQLQRLAPEADAIEFVGVGEVVVKVTDQQDRPVAGAMIEHDVGQSNTYSPSVGDGTFAIIAPTGRARWRIAGTTDAAGSATLLVPKLPTETGIFGWIRVTDAAGTQAHAPLLTEDTARRHGGAEGPLLVRVPQVETKPGAVKGIRPDEVAFAGLTTVSNYSMPGAGYGIHVELPLTIDAQGTLGCQRKVAATRGGDLSVHLLPLRTGTPRYAFMATSSDLLPTVDLDKARTCRIRVVDENDNPLPGCEVAVSPTNEKAPFMMALRPFVLDHAGRAEVLLDGSEWAIYATNGYAHVLEFVDAGTEASDLKLKLQPMPTMRLRVVDSEGKAVRGARAVGVSGGGFSGVLRGARGWAKEGIAAHVALRSATATCSARDGGLVLPVQDWRPMTCLVQIRAGSKSSSTMPLVAATEEQTIVVK